MTLHLEPHPQAIATSNLGIDEWASWVWAGTRLVRPAGQGHHAWKHSLHTSRLRWVLTPHCCSPECICVCFSCESDLPSQREMDPLLSFPERTKNPSPGHRGGLVSYEDAKLMLIPCLSFYLPLSSFRAKENSTHFMNMCMQPWIYIFSIND